MALPKVWKIMTLDLGIPYMWRVVGDRRRLSKVSTLSAFDTFVSAVLLGLQDKGHVAAEEMIAQTQTNS